MRPVSLQLPSYSSSVFANFQPVQTSCDFWVRKLIRCWQHILLLLINPFTPKILVSFFSSPLTIPVSLNFSSNSRVLNQTVFAGGCSISHHFSMRKFVDVVRRNYLLVILESERVKRSPCFFFFICFWEIISRSTCRFSSVNHQHQWTSYCQYLKISGPIPASFGIDWPVWERSPQKKKKKEPINYLLLPYPPIPPIPPPSPPSPPSPSAPFPWLEYPFMTPWIINENHVPVKLVVKG